MKDLNDSSDTARQADIDTNILIATKTKVVANRMITTMTLTTQNAPTSLMTTQTTLTHIWAVLIIMMSKLMPTPIMKKFWEG